MVIEMTTARPLKELQELPPEQLSALELMHLRDDRMMYLMQGDPRTIRSRIVNDALLNRWGNYLAKISGAAKAMHVGTVNAVHRYLDQGAGR